MSVAAFLHLYMFERVKAIANQQFPIDKGMCQMERNMALAARQARIKKLMDELKGLTAEQQTYYLQQYEMKLLSHG